MLSITACLVHTHQLIRLDLDKWIYEPPSESEDESKEDNLSFLLPSGVSGGATSYSPTDSPKGKKKKRKTKRDKEEEEEMKRVSRLEKMTSFLLCPLILSSTTVCTSC